MACAGTCGFLGGALQAYEEHRERQLSSGRWGPGPIEKFIEWRTHARNKVDEVAAAVKSTLANDNGGSAMPMVAPGPLLPSATVSV